MIKTTATLIEKYDAPSGNSSFLLFQPKEQFTFLEGQFMMIETDCGDTTIKKPYSIASTHQQLIETKQIGFYIKKASDAGLSNWLTQHIKPGDTVRLQGPVGHYTDNGKHSNYLFIATGSGISPNLGIFQHLVYESRKFDTIVFIHGERTTNDIIPSVHDLITQHHDGRVVTHIYLSQEKLSGYASGYVQTAITQALKKTSTNVTVFLCGSPAMVQETQQLLLDAHVDKENITTEKR